MDNKEIRVIMCPHDRPAYSVSIVNTLESMQTIVGGYIEPIKLSTNAYIICNEDGRLLNLPQSMSAPIYGLVGDCFICGEKDGEFDDIPKEMEAFLLDQCNHQFEKNREAANVRA